MIRKIRPLLLLLCLTSATTACVSVSLGGKQSKNYENISYTPPPSPYTELQVQSADRSWQNSSNGNTISYMSVCDQSVDPTLEILSSMALDGVENMKIVEQKRLNYNGREALNTVLLGRVDGVPIQADLTVLKKNNCVFNITYIASIHSYMNDLPFYKKFWAGLKIK